MKFKVTYPDGVTVERDQSDCHTVEQMINCMFGSGHNLEKMGIKVESIIEEGGHDPEKLSKSTEPSKPEKNDLPRVVKVPKK